MPIICWKLFPGTPQTFRLEARSSWWCLGVLTIQIKVFHSQGSVLRRLKQNIHFSRGISHISVLFKKRIKRKTSASMKMGKLYVFITTRTRPYMIFLINYDTWMTQPRVELKAILRLFIYKALYDQSYLGSKTTMTTGEWSCLISFAWDIFILNFSLPLRRSEQVSGSHANEIKHDHSPVVIVVLDPRYDWSYNALYINSRSIA